MSGGSSSRSEKLTRFLVPGASPAIMGSTANLGVVARRSVVTVPDIFPPWLSKDSAEASTDELMDCPLPSSLGVLADVPDEDPVIPEPAAAAAAFLTEEAFSWPGFGEGVLDFFAG